MADIIEGIHPTRMELLDINKKVVLAVKGHKLLKEKRDTLMTEFLGVIEEAKGLRSEVIESMDEAYSNLIAAEALMSSSDVQSIANSIPESKKVDISLRNVMGVRIPKMSLESTQEDAASWEYRTPLSTAKIDDSVESFNSVLVKLVKLVEVEETILRLGDEIKKTKRRVNSLEHRMIPRLEATQFYINMRLEEMERETFSSLKAVKRKKERERRQHEESSPV